MKATAVLILALFLTLTLVGPVVAAPPSGADEIGEEIAALTEAISAQLKLLKLYENMGKAAESAATKATLVELLTKQQRAAARLRGLLGGAAAPDQPSSEPSDEPFAGPNTRRESTEPPPPMDGKPLAKPKDLRQVIDRGLDWLAAHQDEKGYWDCDGWMAVDGLKADAGAGYAHFDPGVTGLALLAFLGDGQTHKSGKYKQTLKMGLRYLKQIQDPAGCFGPRTSQRFVYNHAICALAMIEAYAQTASPIFKQSAQSATDFIHKAQNPYLAWRYGVRVGDNDTSVTAWMVKALSAAKRAGLRTSPEAYDGAMVWIEKMTDPEFGRIGYIGRGGSVARSEALINRFPAIESEAMTAAGLATRVHCGTGTGEAYEKGIALCLKKPPVWNEKAGTTDMYYWFWGTMALRQAGGSGTYWPRWRGAIEPILIGNQRTDRPWLGSFDPVGPWGRDGGRIYSTAILTLVAEMATSRKPGK